MSELPPTKGEARTELVEDAPTQEEPAHHTPGESTVGLASSSLPTGVPSRSEGEVAALEIGETLTGRFVVQRFIARGGMGAVYEATDLLLRTRIALKVIGGRLAGDATALERFRREVLLARRVSHPNVCRVNELYEATTARGVPIHFLTMELLEGESLARRLARRGRMTTEDALPLVKQMCEGLAAAHAEGVIHRDFKSSNVLLVPVTGTDGARTTESTRVVITDFGVARAVNLAGEEERGEGPLTGQTILGTPEYMAPEQVTGSEVTAATDIYALGVVLYEMVTGKLPFSADTPLAAAARRLDEPPPRPEMMAPGLETRWSSAIVRCLARRPERRLRSAADVFAALDRPRRMPVVASLGAAAAFLLLLVGVYGTLKYRPSLHLNQGGREAVALAPRQKVAFIGVRDELGSEQLKWLPTAITEILTHELAAAESSLRVVEPEWIWTWHRSLGVTAAEVGDEKAQKRLQAVADADAIAYGVLSFPEPGAGGVRLRTRVLEAGSRKELGSHEDDLGPGGEHLIEGLSGAGASIRNLLGVRLSSEEQAVLSASGAHSLDAARAHAEGVISRQRWDLENAKEHFEAAVAADSSFVQPKRQLVQILETQSDQKRALEVWKSIRDRPTALTARQAVLVDLEITPDREKRAHLFESAPDDLEMGLALAARVPSLARPHLLRRIQQLRAAPPLIIQLREARAAADSGDLKRAEELLDQVARRATELGERLALARARWLQAELISPEDPVRRKEALDRYGESETLYAEVWELDELAQMKRSKSEFLVASGSMREGLAAQDEARGWWRRLGNRPWVAHMLLGTADYLRDFGELAAARKRFQEGRRELEALDESVNGFHFAAAHQVGARLDLDAGDLSGAREKIRRARRTATVGNWPAQVELLEALVLDEEDKREEARAAYWRGFVEPVVKVAGMCTIDCDGGDPAAGLACLAGRCQTADPEFVGVKKASCRFEEARCSVRANDLARAERAAREAADFLASTDYFELTLRVRGVLMRLAAARGQSEKAIRTLRADLARVEAEQNRRLAFETALVLGEVELRAGRPEGRRRLLALEREAKSREFFRIARLAREAIDRKVVASAARHR